MTKRIYICDFCSSKIEKYPSDLKNRKKSFCNKSCFDKWQRKKGKNIKCSLINCDNKHFGRGLCNLHWQRKYILGWGEITKIIEKDIICKLKYCSEKHFGLGYCAYHYRKFKRYGNPLHIKIIEQRMCSKCNKKYYCNNLCRKHYHQSDMFKISRRKYRKNNPEKQLELINRYFKKLGKPFNMSSKEYGFSLQLWSKSVKRRDELCKIECGNKTEISHHILYKSQYPQLSLNLDNGVGLCKLCHYDYHTLNGWK